MGDVKMTTLLATKQRRVYLQGGLTLHGEVVHRDGEAYERFMGRWSRRSAPVFLDFVGVSDGQSVLDVGSGIDAVAGAVLSSTQTSPALWPGEGRHS